MKINTEINIDLKTIMTTDTCHVSQDISTIME